MITHIYICTHILTHLNLEIKDFSWLSRISEFVDTEGKCMLAVVAGGQFDKMSKNELLSCSHLFSVLKTLLI